jgi:hypothetical protein
MDYINFLSDSALPVISRPSGPVNLCVTTPVRRQGDVIGPKWCILLVALQVVRESFY